MAYRFNQVPTEAIGRSPALSSPSGQHIGHLNMPTFGSARGDYTPVSLMPNARHRPMLGIREIASETSNASVMLNNFIAAESHAPWNPFEAFPEFRGQGGSVPAQVGAFNNYRNPAPISVTSDSGYGSLARRYVDDMSSLGDGVLDPEIQRISAQFGSVAFEGKDPRGPDLLIGNAGQAVATGTGGRHELQCKDCGEYVKTKSALKKHHQRHTKPHICTEPGCNRTEGFSTRNDLARHQRSIHKASPSVPGKQYKCTIGQCADKPKIWPRGDNFRSHLKSVHKISATRASDRSYLDGFLYQTICENGPDLLQGIGGESVGTEVDPREFPDLTSWPADDLRSGFPSDSPFMREGSQSSTETEEVRLEYADGTVKRAVATQFSRHQDLTRGVQETLDHLTYGRPDPAFGKIEHNEAKASEMQLQDFPQTGWSTDNPPTIEPHLTFRKPAQKPSLVERGEEGEVFRSAPNVGLSQSPASSQQEAGGSGDYFDSDVDTPISSNAEKFVPSCVGAERYDGNGAPAEDSQLEEVNYIRRLDGIPMEFLTRYMEQKGLHSGLHRGRGSDDSEAMLNHECGKCERRFKRKSDLNKHIRRHAKPYRCTFPGCKSQFGSKSDWRRHENSQHFQLEIWKCDEPVEGGGICTKACHRRDVFECHLQKEHGLMSREELDARQERCRVEWGNNAKFWCGFCRVVVEVNPQLGDWAWNMRYDHIGNHFTAAKNSEERDSLKWDSGGAESDDVEMGEGHAAGKASGKRKRDEWTEVGAAQESKEARKRRA